MNGVSLSSDGSLAVLALANQTLKVWNLSTGQVISTIPTSALIYCCAITPDVKTIVAGDSIGALHFLEWVVGDETMAPKTTPNQKELEAHSIWRPRFMKGLQRRRGQ